MGFYKDVENLGRKESILYKERDSLCVEATRLRNRFDLIAMQLHEERRKKVTSLVKVIAMEENLIQTYEQIYNKEKAIDAVMQQLDSINQQSKIVMRKIIEHCESREF